MQSPPGTSHTDTPDIPLPPSPCPSLSTSSSASPPLSPSPSVYPSSPSFPSPSPFSSSSFLRPLLHPHPSPTQTPNSTTRPTSPIEDHEDMFYVQVQLPIVLRLLRFRARYLYRDSLDARILMDAVGEYFELVDCVIGGLVGSSGEGCFDDGHGERDEEDAAGEGDGDVHGDSHVTSETQKGKKDHGNLKEIPTTARIADDQPNTDEEDIDSESNFPKSRSPSHTLTTADFHRLLYKTLLPHPPSCDGSFYINTHAHLLDGWHLYTTHLLLLSEHSPRAAEMYRTWDCLGEERRDRFLAAVFDVATPRGLKAWVGSVVEGREGVGNEDLEVQAVERVMGEFWGEGVLGGVLDGDGDGETLMQEVRDGDEAVKERKEQTEQWDRFGRAYAREALFRLRREALLERLDAWIECIALPEPEAVESGSVECKSNAGPTELRKYLLDQILGLTENAQGSLTLDMDINAWVDFLAALLFRRMSAAEVPVSANTGPQLRKRRRDLSLLGVLLARDRLDAVLEGRDDEVAGVMRMEVAVLVRRLVLELVGRVSIREDGAMV